MINNRVDRGAERADEVGAEHREEEVGLVQEAGLLVLRHDVDDVEGSPADDEGEGDGDNHAGHLLEKNQ